MLIRWAPMVILGLCAVVATGCGAPAGVCTGSGCGPVGDDVPPVNLCSGRVCGPNSNGLGSCGDCVGGMMCSNGQCVAGGGNDAGVPPICPPNATRSCACSGGGMGVQTCNGAGSGYSVCDCPPAARCGDGTCNGMETCSTCAGDCGQCAAVCGDRTCNGTETCMSCPGDCMPCPTMPRCGDSTCNGSETCTTCSDDCGICPPRCGDGTCNGAETCTSCVGDCGACETMCTPCATNADCGAGSDGCFPRRCDGARGCYATATSGCALIGGIRCPPTSAYNICTTNAECGPYAICQRFGDGRQTCARRCTADTDCPSPPTGSTTVAACDRGNTPRTCFLVCRGPGTCPFGLSCFRFGDGTYGYCS